MDAKAVKDYCEDCEKTKNKPIAENKLKVSNDDDLLEFLY
jgi:hypothetical protein